MRKLIIGVILFLLISVPVSAMELTPPTVPDGVEQYMPEEQESFADGLMYILKTALSSWRPEIADVTRICMSVIVAVLMMSILNNVSESNANAVKLTGAVIIGLLLLEPVNTMIRLGTDTVTSLSEYGKLLLPVMTAALAAQGGTSTSAALYAGTVFFNTLLTMLISRLIVPAVFVYLCLSVASCALEQDMLKQLRDFVKWAMTWCLKMVLYLFTGYIGITGVISGTVDKSVLKATKLTISGVVPVVGGILSDASETILVSAGVMKNAAGIYGIFAILALCIGPFLQIAVPYLLLKLCGAICGLFGYKPAVGLIKDFTTGMGTILAMTGTVCMLLLISLVCFMKGMS